MNKLCGLVEQEETACGIFCELLVWVCGVRVMVEEESRDVERVELDLLLEAIWQLYAYDFRQYARSSMLRRVRHRMKVSGMSHISEMIPRVMHDPAFFNAFLEDMSKTVTEMFRDPGFCCEVRKKVAPILAQERSLKIWHAGCATGEEVYSMAIILEEEGLLDRASIFGTDYNYQALASAEEGVYPLSSLSKIQENYKAAGGVAHLSKYLNIEDDCLTVSPRLKKHVKFSYHNLISDAPLQDIDILVCRNVLIYFERPLQERVIENLWRGLKTMGYLCLGAKESLDASSLRGRFGNVSYNHKIFRKI